MAEKKYQIFISSTFIDLTNAREKVISTILKMHHSPIGIEMFSADNDEKWEVIKDVINQSDYFILLVGQRYGSLANERISYTEKEYDYANSIGVPVMSFIRHLDIATSPIEREINPNYMEKLNLFIEKVKRSKMVDVWNNTDELALKVSVALYKIFTRHPRNGWVRSNSVITTEVIDGINSETRKLRGNHVINCHYG